MRGSISGRFTFESSFQMMNPKWSYEKNLAVFGKTNVDEPCLHTYQLMVTVSGELDLETGFVVDLKLLRSLINKEVIQKMNHKNLNKDMNEFKGYVPTCEIIAYVIWTMIRSKIHPRHEIKITIQEDENTIATYGEA
ncbi:MAG TPA: 6-carboxytetrahydropterin synthase [Bacteroidia bacterium]|nr:6-carboxytetrahydropterin synthase [Bacteroidota bacterium]MBL0053360.1 6-carboxytetrahydropterin synthase [Bacteroidota bacterium]HRC32622.1 6-carboxytetrahydropterin synthase [Bacteroidia bacterium]